MNTKKSSSAVIAGLIVLLSPGFVSYQAFAAEFGDGLKGISAEGDFGIAPVAGATNAELKFSPGSSLGSSAMGINSQDSSNGDVTAPTEVETGAQAAVTNAAAPAVAETSSFNPGPDTQGASSVFNETGMHALIDILKQAPNRSLTRTDSKGQSHGAKLVDIPLDDGSTGTNLVLSYPVNGSQFIFEMSPAINANSTSIPMSITEDGQPFSSHGGGQFIIFNIEVASWLAQRGLGPDGTAPRPLPSSGSAQLDQLVRFLQVSPSLSTSWSDSYTGSLIKNPDSSSRPAFVVRIQYDGATETTTGDKGWYSTVLNINPETTQIIGSWQALQTGGSPSWQPMPQQTANSEYTEALNSFAQLINGYGPLPEPSPAPTSHAGVGISLDRIKATTERLAGTALSDDAFNDALTGAFGESETGKDGK